MHGKLAILLLSLLFLGTAGAFLEGCSMVHGAGEDLKSGSNAGRNAM